MRFKKLTALAVAIIVLVTVMVPICGVSAAHKRDGIAVACRTESRCERRIRRHRRVGGASGAD